MRNAERYVELLELEPGWLELDSGAAVEQRVPLQDATRMRGPGIKLRQDLASSNQISLVEAAR
jgi:hypothetical protein